MSGTRVPSFVLGVLLTSAVESGVTGTRRDTCSADPGLRLVTGSTACPTGQGSLVDWGPCSPVLVRRAEAPYLDIKVCFRILTVSYFSLFTVAFRFRTGTHRYLPVTYIYR